MSSASLEALFRAAYAEHLAWMLNTVRRLGVRESDVEDVAHDVFSTAWRRLDTYAPERPMRPWLFGIAFRVISGRKVAKSGHEELEPELDDPSGRAHRPDELWEAELTRRNVLQALHALPEDQRAVFVGHDIEATPITELAEALEIPLNTAYSRLRLARQRFEQAFAKLRQEARP